VTSSWSIFVQLYKAKLPSTDYLLLPPMN